MIEEAPDPKEVSHYHFSQLRPLQAVKNNEIPPKGALNVIAPASKYGMLFVGICNGFKVLKLENILDLDEDKENKNAEENYYSRVISCETPIVLALSADQKTLAVCAMRNSTIFVDFYDIAAFADPDEAPVPFLSAPLAASNCALREFVWNPVIDAMYAFCLSDGSLHVYELNGMQTKAVGQVANADATAVCWSPKGKQLVVGKRNGSFTQYKPTLQEVKTIPAPAINENVFVSNICWISTAQFAVLYAVPASSASPFLFMISTPKNAPVVYTNFYDVCLGNSSNIDQRYFMHHESAWGILICASTDSIEIAVLGDPPSWVQWELKDDGRALLPSKNGAKCAISTGVMYCAQRRIVINEIESYPPMPVIFFLTDNGLLLPYHMINSAPGCMSLVRPSSPIDREGERKRPDTNQNTTMSTVQSLPQTFNVANNQPIINPISSPPTSVFKFPGTPTNLSFAPTSTPQFGFGQGGIIKSNEPPMPSFGTSTPFQSLSVRPVLTLPQAIEPTGISPEMERYHKSAKGFSPAPLTPHDASATRHVAVAQRLTSGIKIDSGKEVPRVAAVPDSKVVPDKTPVITHAVNEDLQKQNTFLSAICEEMNTFEKEIQNLKTSSQQFKSIGSKEEMALLKNSVLEFESFKNEMSETMASLNSDIHTLKSVLLESFVMIEEANSKERRKNDHNYISMLEDRALDPMTAKRMQEIERHYLYLSSQLQEVSNRLDQDWFEFLEKKKESRRASSHVSSTEAIYKSVVNNQKIIHNLRQSMDQISKKVDEMKLENIAKRKNKTVFMRKSGPEELSKLADAFLQAKISTSEEEKPRLTKKIPTQAQAMLRNYLASSNVSLVKPTVVYSPSQSRLISKTLLYADKSIKNKTPTSITLNQDSKIAKQPVADNKEIILQKHSLAAKSAFPEHPPTLLSLNEINKNILSPINKPQVTSAAEFEKLRQGNVAAVENTGTEQIKELMKSNQAALMPISPLLEFRESSPESPLYEEITPPDSPSQPNYGSQRLSTTASDVLPSNGSEFKVIQSSKNEMKNSTQDISAQQNTMFPSSLSLGNAFVSSLHENKSPSFSIPSSTSALSGGKHYTTLFHSDSTPKSSSGLLENFGISSATANQANKPTTVKPTTAFSFLPPPSTTLGKDEKSLPSESTLKIPQPSSIFNFGVKSGSASSPFFSAMLSKDTENAEVSDLTSGKSLAEDGKPKSSFFSSIGTSSPFLPTSGSKGSFFNIPSSKSLDVTSPAVPVSSGSFFTLLSDTSSASLVQPTVVKFPEGTSVTAVPSPPSTEPEEAVSTSVSPSPSQETLENDTENSNQASNVSEPLSDKALVITVSSSESLPSVFGSNSTQTVSLTTVNEKNFLLTSQVTATPVLGQLPSKTPVFGAAGVLVSQPSVVSSAGNVPFVFGSALVTSQPSSAVSSTSFSSVFGSGAAASQPSSIFGAAALTAQQSPAVVTPASSTVSATADVPQTAGTPTSAETVLTPALPVIAPALVGETVPATSAETSSVAAETPAATVPSTAAVPIVFGSAQTTTGTSFFNPAPTTTAGSGPFSSFFGTPATTTPVLGQNTLTQSSPFGITPTTSASSEAPSGGSFFSQTASGQSTGFGSAFSSNSAFGGGGQSAASSFSFGKPAFGQTQGTFGLSKSVFGGQSTQPTFGQPATTTSSSFGATSGGSVFGQGTFFSGLGAQPSAENASKNFFSGSVFGKPTTESTNVFGSSGAATVFGAKSGGGGTFTGGSFSSGMGSVAQSGFGAFQQTPEKTGFGSAPAFGAPAAFGSSPSFGSPPSFGLGSVFGSPQNNQTANFSNFASGNTPSFSSLASQTPGGFGAAAQQQQQQPVFGQQSGVFGASSGFGGASAFGGQPSSFGNPGGNGTGGSSAFTQWRS